MLTVGSIISGIGIGSSASQVLHVIPHATGVKGLATGLDDSVIIQTLGHSVSGNGAASYHYQLNSTSTVNSGTIFFGPGGSGRMNLIGDTYVIDVMKFGARGDLSTDDTAAINRAITHAVSLANTYRRPVLYFPPGRRYLVSRLEVPRYIDIEMTGAVLYSASTEYDKPILSIGSSGVGSLGANLAGKFMGLHVEYNGAFSTHGYPETGNNDYFGIRIINALDCIIDVSEVQGFYGGVQLLSSGNAVVPCAHNTVTIGSIYACKIGVDLQSRGNGYTNENIINNGNFATSSTMTNYGSAYGVRFSTDGVYKGQNNNLFVKPCFQLGSWKLTWTAGLSIGLNYRVYYNGNEYLALNTGTTGATPPTHTSGSASDGTINWQYVGPYRRSAVYHRQAGSLNRFVGSRWESAIGSFAVVSGILGPNVYEFEYYNDVDDGNAVRQIEDLENATDVIVYSANSYMLQGQDIIRPQSIGINNLHHRAVNGVSGWTIAGMGFHHFFTNGWRTYTSGDMRLCRDSLYINCYSNGSSGFVSTVVADIPYCIVDVQQNHRFRVDRSIGGGLTGNETGRVYNIPLTDSFTRMDLETSAVPNKPILLGSSTSVSPLSGYDAMRTGSDTAVHQGLVVHHSVPYVLIGFFDVHLEGFTITKVMDTYPYLRSNDIAVFCKEMTFGETARSSVGTPRYGFFGKRGEMIMNHVPSVGNPTYWVVTTPGILAPTFTGGASVVKGEVRVNGSNVYAVNSAGTCGGSAPTGTSSGISDGTLTWDYIGTTATLTAGPNL